MIPILFEKNTMAFAGGGICRLSEALSWKVKEVLNGEFELEMIYPASGEHFSEIQTERIIFAKPNPFDNPQAFVIYAISKPLKGRVQIYAEHVSHKQSKITVSPFHAENLKGALAAVQEAAVGENPFQFSTELDVENEINSNIPRTLRNSIYGRIISLYGGEIKYDNYSAVILARRGENKGFAVRYGKNLLDFNQREDVSDIYDGIYPYYFNQDPEDEEEFEYVELPEKIIKIGDTAERIMPLDLTREFQEEPDEDELREAAQRYLEQNDINKGSFSVKLDFAILSQTEEYKNKIPPERVELGDDVAIYIPIRGVTVRSRIVKTVYDGKKNRYESVTVGDIQKDITNTIAGVKEQTVANGEKINRVEKTVMKIRAEGIDIDVVEAINARADEINLESDILKIKSTGFSLENGAFTATRGEISGWQIGHSEDFGGNVIITTSAQYKNVEWTDSEGPHFVTGNVFTALTEAGIYYLIKGVTLPSLEVVTLGIVSAMNSPVFTEPSTGEGEVV